MATGKMTGASWRSFLEANWDLGFTAFGGPPVHFKIVSRLTELDMALL